MTKASQILPASRRLPAAGKPVPTATYRLQLSRDFTFAAAAAQVDYYAALGVSHLYLSPILTAAPGSTHGYDVVDHARIWPDLGGREGFDLLVAAAHGAGLGLIVDVVPNHMGVPTPAWHNRQLWSVLAQGQASPFAHWFDIDWDAGDDALLMPVLGDRIGAVLARGELWTETIATPTGDEVALRYFDHVFPVRAGTENLPLADLVSRQHYRLAYWRVADEELNYRRFFDVGSLVAIRVEQPDVFAATHALLIELVHAGAIDGLRIDHVDGLADPGAYLDALYDATHGAWIVVEKILAPGEPLPAGLRCAGTTGYETSWRLGALHTKWDGERSLAALMREVTGDASEDFEPMVRAAKEEIIAGPLLTEVNRLSTLAGEVCAADVRLRDHTRKALRDCLVELLIAAERYRYYCDADTAFDPTAAPALLASADRARRHLPADLHDTLQVVIDLLLSREVGSAGHTKRRERDEFVVRFQQTCGAVLAKGVEDTAFYRWTQLLSACEVGGDPPQFALGTSELHAWCEHVQTTMPLTLISLSTHDNKRSFDTRVALAVISEYAREFSATEQDLRALTASARPPEMDGRIEHVLWQVLAGTFDGAPLPAPRLTAFLRKAMREAKTHTSWTQPDEAYEDAVLAFAAMVAADAGVTERLAHWAHLVAPAVRTATLSLTGTWLTMPGIPDVYQGTETVRRLLVDPDNRAPVDYLYVRSLAELADPVPDLAQEKFALTAALLRLRRRRAGLFADPLAGYEPLATTSDNVFAFARTAAGVPQVLTVAARLVRDLESQGGWGNHSLQVPAGTWRAVVGERTFTGGAVQIADLLERSPVVVLERVDG